ncbi:MAG: cellobiose phosphorylase [Candidatus Omnitrophica bacterium]|nr:cellobiose phosphorylase [Candidatus Omnitrophota bacterium]
MKNPAWKFVDDKGTFTSENADKLKSLYFPLCNNSPFMSCVSPDLHGDAKTGVNNFLLEPVSRHSLADSKLSRNFWIYLGAGKIWSASGFSKDLKLQKNDKFRLEGGLLWQKTTRENRKLGIKAAITSFVPQSGEPVEIMEVRITNISAKRINFIPTAAIPIYGRSLNNLHDHRHVTSLLNRIQINKNGVVLTPTLSFNESGHEKNSTSYFVLGATAPQYIYPTQESFCADDTDLEAPKAVFENQLPGKSRGINGKEAFGGLRFPKKTLLPGKSYAYIILLGIAKLNNVKTILNKFNTPQKVQASLEATKKFWAAKANEISVRTSDANFNNWLKWVEIQPTLRRVFGCSFLPDFDYGRGGRGWRDLWQDCLSLILTQPETTRNLLINNFKGIRIDGSNATIIGQKPGEFIADRNNITRVWMDHGVWPLITTHLYLHQTADLKLLLEKVSYFRDPQLSRGRKKDHFWQPQYGRQLKTKAKIIYSGSVLEHILVQNLVQFFNVGPHNLIRLENADWNDGLDMAYTYGESVAFSAMYAQNLLTIAQILERMPEDNIVIFKELSLLLDVALGRSTNYSSAQEKIKRLEAYFQAVEPEISGKTINIPTAKLIFDLRKKGDWLTQQIRKTEWIKPGIYNSYYNNHKQKIDGYLGKKLQIALTGQVFAIISGIATQSQCAAIFQNACKHLRSPALKGFALNTDFGKEQLDLGRAFSFVYGDKENGAFFNHMSVMFAYGLYKRGLVKEGSEVFDSIYKMALDSSTSKIYPCLPEYFNLEGRGMYCYLTGSASWFMFTLLTQVFGIRGEYGNLVIEPKLTSRQFGDKNVVSINTEFARRKIEIMFINRGRKDFGKYAISRVSLNKKILVKNARIFLFSLKRSTFLSLAKEKLNTLEVILL